MGNKAALHPQRRAGAQHQKKINKCQRSAYALPSSSLSLDTTEKSTPSVGELPLLRV
jgi:hypothetical protein